MAELVPYEIHRERISRLEEYISHLTKEREVDFKDYENLKKEYSRLERRFYKCRKRDCDEINELRYKLKCRDEMLSDKDEQLENYRIAVGILVAVIAFYVALTVAV